MSENQPPLWVYGLIVGLLFSIAANTSHSSDDSPHFTAEEIQAFREQQEHPTVIITGVSIKSEDVETQTPFPQSTYSGSIQIKGLGTTSGEEK